MLTLDPFDTSLDVVLTDGTIASGPGEITIGPRTAEATGLDVGDTVDVPGTDGDVELTVTGIGFVFPSPHNERLRRLGDRRHVRLFVRWIKFHLIVIDVASGVDPLTVSDRLGTLGIRPTRIPRSRNSASSSRSKRSRGFSASWLCWASPPSATLWRRLYGAADETLQS